MIRSPRGQRAFTLVELMVTVAVLSILLVVAMPSFRDLTSRSQIQSANNALLADLAYARTEAIMRAMFVSLCPSADGVQCTGSDDYAKGWIVYTYPVSLGANNTYKDNAADFILLRHRAPQRGVSVKAADNKIITYGQQGQLKRAEDDVPLRFAICTAHVEHAAAVPGSQLEVSGSGSAHSKTMASGAGCPAS